MQDRIIDTEAAQAGGWLAYFGSLLMGFLEFVTFEHVNDLLQILLSIGGVIFIVYKIINARLDAKLKKKQLEKEDEE